MDEENTNQGLPLVNPQPQTQQASNNNSSMQINSLESRLTKLESKVDTIDNTVENLPQVNDDPSKSVGNSDMSGFAQQVAGGQEEQPQQPIQNQVEQPEQQPSLQPAVRTASVVQTDNSSSILSDVKAILNNIYQSLMNSSQASKTEQNSLLDKEQEVTTEGRREREHLSQTLAKLDFTPKVKEPANNAFHWTDALLLAVPIIIAAGKKIWQGIGQCLMNLIASVGPILQKLGFTGFDYQSIMNSLASSFGVSYSSPQMIEEKKSNGGSSSAAPSAPSGGSSVSSSTSSSGDKDKEESSSGGGGGGGSSSSSSSGGSGKDDKQPQGTSGGGGGSGGSSTGGDKKESSSAAPVSSGGGGKVDSSKDSNPPSDEKKVKPEGDPKELEASKLKPESPDNPTAAIESVINSSLQKADDVKTSEPVQTASEEKSSGSATVFGEGLFGFLHAYRVPDDAARKMGYKDGEDFKRQLYKDRENKKLREQNPEVKPEPTVESKDNVSARRIQDEKNEQNQISVSNESSMENHEYQSGQKLVDDKNSLSAGKMKTVYYAKPASSTFVNPNQTTFYKYKPAFFKRQAA